MVLWEGGEMMKKARCFIQVFGEMSGLHGKKIPVMRDWVVLLPSPIDLLSVTAEALEHCRKEGITNGEVVHFQKIGIVEQDD